jgi:hypothetical protein
VRAACGHQPILVPSPDSTSEAIPDKLATHAQIVEKAINAKSHGAVGMILGKRRGKSPRRAGGVDSLWYPRRTGGLGLAVIQVATGELRK